MRRRYGLSVTELILVMAIVGALLALLLPALAAAREAARRVLCQNHLRQIGVGVLSHLNSHGHFPTGGWGFRWVGDPHRGFGRNQPGGWIFNTLPFLNHSASSLAQPTRRASARALPGGDGIRSAVDLESPVALFYCPSRRVTAAYPYTLRRLPLRNAKTPDVAAKSDYAVNAGDRKVSAGPGGPDSVSAARSRKYRWPDTRDVTGVSFVRSTIGVADLTDGSSKTYLAGEKHVPQDSYALGHSGGDDQTLFVGDDADIRRWTTGVPVADGDPKGRSDRFGSAHVAGCSFVYCDGSVRVAGYDVDPKIHRSLGNRRDGLPSRVTHWAD